MFGSSTRKVFFALCLGVCAAAPLRGASMLHFPRLVLDSDTLTGIAIVNTTAMPASVTFTAYGSDGRVLQAEGLRNPRQVLILSGQQYARTTAEVFGTVEGLEEAAWFEAVSPADDLTGFFLILDPALSRLDGAQVAAPAEDLIFPEIQLGPDRQTEVNVVNVGGGAARVRVRLLGALPRETVVDLPPRGALRFEVAELFDLEEDPGPSFLRVEANDPVSGFAFVRTPRDWLGLGAQPAGEDREVYFPQFAALGGFRSQLKLINLSTARAEMVLTAHRPDGSVYGPPEAGANPVIVSLRGGEILCRDIEELFGLEGPGPLQGWLEVRSSQRGVHGSLNYELPGTGALAAVSAEGEGSRELAFSHIATRLGFFTGVALLNTARRAANVQLAALSSDGEIVGETHLALGPGERISRLLAELIPEADERAGGFFWVRSDLPLRATSLFGTLGSEVLANIPPQLFPGYQPPGLDEPLRVEPSLAVVTAGSEAEFSLEGGRRIPVWSAAGGTIDALGTFQAPADVPASNPILISAQLDGRSYGASADWLRTLGVLPALAGLRAVVHFPGSDSVYTAEVSAAVGVEAGGAVPSGVSTAGTFLFRHRQGAREQVLMLQDDTVSDLLSYPARNGVEYLLLLLGDSGAVFRLDPGNGALLQVGRDFDLPTQMALAPSGELYVAEAGGLSRLRATDLERGLFGPATPQPARRQRVVISAGVSAVSIDPCDGQPLFVLEGRLVKARGDSGEVTRELGEVPGADRLLALRRGGLPCAEGLEVLAAGEERSWLVLPGPARVLPWLEVPVRDFSFIGAGGSAFGPPGVLMARPSAASQDGVSLVPLDGIYQLP